MISVRNASGPDAAGAFWLASASAAMGGGWTAATEISGEFVDGAGGGLLEALTSPPAKAPS